MTRHPVARPSRPRCGPSAARGFTLIEILIVMALAGTLAAIAVPRYLKALDAARKTRAVGDIKNMSVTITLRQMQTGRLPDGLVDVGFDSLRDPWGRPYVYLKLDGRRTIGAARKDKNLVPLNGDFDLYSVGPDGATAAALTAKVSFDDIIRANNGGFIGAATDY